MLNKKPNIVIVVPEQWRGDAVGCAGHPVVKTPNLDCLAEEGLYFSRAFTTHPICVPSRCSLLTGWYPHTRGHRTQRYLLGIDEPNLFRYLKSHATTSAISMKIICLSWLGRSSNVRLVLPSETLYPVTAGSAWCVLFVMTAAPRTVSGTPLRVNPG